MPWLPSNPDTWTGFEILFSCLTRFPFLPLQTAPCSLYHFLNPHSGRIVWTIVYQLLSWSVPCSRYWTTCLWLLYMFTILMYGECKKYVRLFRSEQGFVYWEICEQKVGLLNKLLLLWCCVTCTHTEPPHGPVHHFWSFNHFFPVMTGYTKSSSSDYNVAYSNLPEWSVFLK